MENSWTPESWKKLSAEQQPDWGNNKEYTKQNMSKISEKWPRNTENDEGKFVLNVFIIF